MILAIGSDLCNIERIQNSLNRWGEKFENRVFTEVERAKGILMEKMKLNEPESFRWIQKTSMDRRLTMREVAEAVIEQMGGK